MSLPHCEYDKAYRQGEKFSAKPKTDMKLGTNSRSVGTRTGADVKATLVKSLIGPWTEWQQTHKLLPMSMEPWAATKKALQ